MGTKIVAVAALLMAAFFASAQSFWDGGAALERGDASFESGYFAASNSFPTGTQVIVENLETGRTTTVLVSGRIEGKSDLLIVLSPKAAAALGILTGDVAPVRVTLKAAAPTPGGSPLQEQALSRDSDINPAAGAPLSPVQKPVQTAEAPKTTEAPKAAETPAKPPAETPKQPPVAEAPKTPEAAPTAATPEQPGVLESLPKGAVPKTAAAAPPKAAEPVVPAEKKPAETPPTVAQKPVEPVQAPATTAPQAPAKTTPSPEEQARELASRNPQKQLYQPPREDQKFAYQPPATPPSYVAAAPKTPEKPAQTVPEAPATPEIASVDGSPTAPGGQALAEVAPPVPTAPAPGSAEEMAAVPPELSTPAPTAPGGEALAAITPPVPPVPAPGSAEELAAIPPELSSPAPAVPAPETRTMIALEPAAPKPPEAAAVKAPEKPPAVVAEKPQAPVPEVAAPKTSPVSPPTQVAQAPSGELPAEKPSVQLSPTAPQAPQTPAAKTQTVARANFFLQLGAYADEKQARDLAARVPPSYPVSVVAPASNGTRYFRILLGPLNKAESGTLLYWFRDRGFPDAFVKPAE